MARKGILSQSNAAQSENPDNASDRGVTTLESLSPSGRSRSQRNAWIVSIAAKLAGSQVKNILDDAANADEIRKRSAVVVLWELMKLTKNSMKWGDDTQILGTWPEPGTAEKGVKKDKVIIIPPTKDNALRVPEWIAEAKPNGGEGTIDVSAYRQIIEDMEPDVVNRIRLIKQASDKDSNPIADNPYLDWTQSQRDIEKGRLNSVLTNGAERLRKGMAVYYKIAELHNEFSDEIEIRLDTAQRRVDGKKTGEVYLRSGTIIIQDKSNPAVGKAFDASAFIRLDVKKAIAEGGEYKHIIASGKAKRTGRRNLDSDAISKFTLVKCEEALALMSHFMDDADKSSALSKKIKSDAGVDVAISAYEVAHKMMRPFRDPNTGRLTALGKKIEEEIRNAENEEPAPTPNAE